MAKVVIFGTGDFGELVHFYLSRDSSHEIVAFTVDEAQIRQRDLFGLPVVPFETLESHYPPGEFSMFVAVGYRRVNRARTEVYERCKARGYQLITYVNSKAFQWGEVTFGDNCFIMEALIHPFVTIGNNVMMLSRSSLGHHTTIGNHCFITAHAVIASRVRMEESCFVGVNATVRDHVTIARSTVIGAGAVILKDTKENGVYLAPAAELSRVPSNRLPNL